MVNSDNFLFQGKCLPTTVEPLQNGYLRSEERWPLWGGRGVTLQNYFRKYKMFIVLF